MNMKSRIQSIVLASCACLALSACTAKKEVTDNRSQEAQAPAAEEKAASGPQFQADAAFQQQLASVFSSYVTLKDAFVATDAAKVKAEATNVTQALAKADMKLLSGAAHNDWMAYSAGIETALKEMQGASDIEAQRAAFKNLSDGLYKSIKAYGLGGATAFYEYCPMAFNNTGAYWLSNEEKIRNPYFGDKMLTCGSVKETLN